MPLIRAGDLRDRVTVQQDTGTVADADSYGEVPQKWTTVAVRWANVTEDSGREDWQAQQVRPSRAVTVRMRYMASLTTKHRLLVGTRVLQIGSVINPDGVRVEHVVSCTEEV